MTPVLGGGFEDVKVDFYLKIVEMMQFDQYLFKGAETTS